MVVVSRKRLAVRGAVCRKMWLTLIVLGLLLIPARAGSAAPEPKTVLILKSYGENFKPWSEYATALRQELGRRSQWPLTFREFSVITGRGEDQNTGARFIGYLQALFEHRAPDLIVAFGAPAAAFVERHRSELFPATPVLLTAIDARRIVTLALTENDTVVAVRKDIPAIFANILQLLPNTRTIAMLFGNSPNERLWTDEFKRELQPLTDRVDFRFYNDRSFSEILSDVASLPPDSVIYWNALHVDVLGFTHEADAALKEVAAVANAPIFSYDDTFLTGEIVGGPMSSLAASTRGAAEAALRILLGEKPADVKTPTLEYGPAKYDWRQLRRWGISESRLPPGSEIYFREPSLWEIYSRQMLAIVAVLIVQAGLISVLLHERRRRSLAEVQSRQRMSELAHVNRFSVAGALTATIAHELNQPLGAILTNAEAAELIVKSQTPDMKELAEILADIRRDDERAGDVIRRLRSLLRKTPFELRDIDLNDVVRETIGFVSALAIGKEVGLTTRISEEPLPIKGDRIQLQQVILNLIVNAIDASSSRSGAELKIMVSTAREFDNAAVSVSDDGPGFPPEKLNMVFEPFFTTKPNGMGIGLSIAKSIVEAHGGQLSAHNRAGGGAEVRLTLKLAARR